METALRNRVRRPRALWIAVAAALAAGARAQSLPAPAPAAFETPAAGTPAATALAAARELLATSPAEAAGHFAAAALHHPFAAEVLEGLARSSDALRPLVVHRWTASLADAKGAIKLPPELKKLLGDDRLPERLAQARVAALAELGKWTAGLKNPGRVPGAIAAARWARDAAMVLAGDAPRAARELTVPIEAAIARLQPGPVAAVAPLEALLARASARGDPGEMIVVARRLLALARQAAGRDTQGAPPPDLGAVERKAAEALDRARDALARTGAPVPLAELEAMDGAAREAFTRDHATWASPGISESPGKRYRVETVCGHDTLLEAARTVERHHARLAGWFGADPFEKEQGLLRVVPEAHELEGEGTPYWWAGGFQSGRITTVCFQTGTVEGLGRGVTHELTHRFDGAIYPGLPAWLAEGRAVWTAAAYGSLEDTTFAENHVSFGTVEQAFVKGYGATNDLERLILGTIEDYRDNYTAGYALWVYLKLWEDGAGRPLFAPRIDAWMRGYSKPANRTLAWFTRHFADDKNGRPKDFEAFAKGFAEFLRGFYWQSRAPWTAKYEVKFKRASAPYILDGPTWGTARDRAEPFFGQDHLGPAAELLLAAGDAEGAAILELVRLGVDEPDAAGTTRLAALLEGAKQPDAAWATRRSAALRGVAAGDDAPCPFLRQLPKTAALLETLREVARAAAGAGSPAAAAAIEADAAALASCLGLPPPPLPAAPAGLPLDPPPMALALFGWDEDGLTGYEERRVKGLWYPDGAAITVGREKPREGTGMVDRQAHQRDAFVRSKLWNRPGRSALSGRVRFTTSFVSGAIVLGYTRRDRQVRLSFSAGDFLYAIGRKDDRNEIDGVGFTLHGLRGREDHLEGSVHRHRVKFPSPRDSFRFEVLVDGGMVQARVDGEVVATYHTLDGAAVEGYAGFAAGQGAFRVEDVSIQRRDREQALGLGEPVSRPFDPAAPGPATAEALLNHRLAGTPRAPHGTLAVLVPLSLLDDSQIEGGPDGKVALYDGARDLATATAEAMARRRIPQDLLVLLPARAKGTWAAALAAELRGILGRDPLVLRHARGLPAGKDAAEEDGLALFVDPHGVIRHLSKWQGRTERFPYDFERWIDVFRRRSE